MRKRLRITIALRATAVLGLLLGSLPLVAEEPSAADKAFDNFQRLTGTWTGKSSKGWENEMSTRVIAGGTVVVMTDSDSDPNEQMLTTVFRDGEDLMLTHYCISGNQPTLLATSISRDGREVHFELRGATNLSSRDQGHMDKAIYRFLSEDKFTSNWRWYQDGKEQWLEEIHYLRTDASGSTASPDDLLNRLTGTWVLEGTIAGKQVTHDVVAERVLRRNYIKLHEVSRENDATCKPEYEAIVILEWDENAGEYACLWLDSTSGGGLLAQIIGHSKPHGDEIRFLFEGSDGSRFHTTFAYIAAADTWRWRMDSEKEDRLVPFARVTLRRAR